MTTFHEMGLLPEILKSLNEIGFENPTPIQEKSIPQVLENESDLIALAQTGTGKTAAFSLPILNKLDIKDNSVQSLILCPTRELCLQISKDIETFSKNIKGISTVSVYGGTKIETQIKALKKGAHIVVATPGRALDLINRKKLKLNSINFLVLDEADEMLTMGFKDDLDEILSTTPREKQTLLFSATMPAAISKMGKNYMNDPVEISVGNRNAGSADVVHHYYSVNNRNRYEALKRLADVNPDIYGIVFCRTRANTQDIATKLMADGYNADAIHGDLSQAQRDEVMGRFRKKNLQILVATDVAARGLDVNNLTHVINYQLPDEPEVYIHRSGRTGRAGNKGVSISIISPGESRRIKELERLSQKEFELKQVPSGKEICERQLFSLIDKVEKTEVNEDQIAPFLSDVYKKLDGMDKEEIIKKFVSTEFNSFLSYYKNSRDLDEAPGSKSRKNGSKGSRGSNGNSKYQRYHINIGKKDKLNAARLIGLINDQIGDRDADIGKIEVLSSFSFFELEQGFENITKSFKGTEFEGRSVSVEEAASKGKKRSGKSGDNNNFLHKKKRKKRKRGNY